MLVFVKLLITFSISMYIMCVMFVRRFESRGRRFTIFHYNNGPVEVVFFVGVLVHDYAVLVIN